MVIQRSDVVDAYRWLLNREPESVARIDSLVNKNINPSELRSLLINSDEFKKKNLNLFKEESSASASVSIQISYEKINHEKLIFLHIPKTGGTTLHSFLTEYFDADKVCPARFNTLGDFTVGELVNYHFFSGHYSLPTCSVIPGDNNKIITFLREPRARLISAYYFWRSHVLRIGSPRLPVLANQYSFCEFLEHPDICEGSNTFNPYVQLLTGELPSGEFANYGNVKGINGGDKLLLQKAITALDSLAFYGLLEKYDESVSRLVKLLGIDFEGKLEKKMVLTDLVSGADQGFKVVEKEEWTDKHENLVQRNTYLDALVYEHARKKFS